MLYFLGFTESDVVEQVVATAAREREQSSPPPAATAAGLLEQVVAAARACLEGSFSGCAIDDPAAVPLLERLFEAADRDARLLPLLAAVGRNLERRWAQTASAGCDGPLFSEWAAPTAQVAVRAVHSGLPDTGPLVVHEVALASRDGHAGAVALFVPRIVDLARAHAGWIPVLAAVLERDPDPLQVEALAARAAAGVQQSGLRLAAALLAGSAPDLAPQHVKSALGMLLGFLS